MLHKMHTVMKEYKEGELHSGSKTGPKVTSRAQAIAIGLSEARKAGEDVSPPRGRSRGKFHRGSSHYRALKKMVSK